MTSSGLLKSKILGNNLVETEIGIPKTTLGRNSFK